jgi:hypothetical protein
MNAVAASSLAPVSTQPVVTLRTIATQAAPVAARQWHACAGVVADLASRNGVPARRARVYISFEPLTVTEPSWGAWFWEEDVPEKAEPVDWFLPSQQPVCCVEDALLLLRKRPDLVTRLDCR